MVVLLGSFEVGVPPTLFDSCRGNVGLKVWFSLRRTLFFPEHRGQVSNVLVVKSYTWPSVQTGQDFIVEQEDLSPSRTCHTSRQW